MFFMKVEGFDMPVVTNTAGNRRLLPDALEVAEEACPPRIGSGAKTIFPSKSSTSPPGTNW